MKGLPNGRPLKLYQVYSSRLSPVAESMQMFEYQLFTAH